MASNSFGTLFRITTWGESHGKAIGVVIDGCPAGLPIEIDEINDALKWRAPGRNSYTSPRLEKDQVELLSGVFEGKTTGTPLSILIHNQDSDSSKYETIKDLYRPGHANFTYLEKYGIFDYRGGGRSSARETACRVAAGAIAKKILAHYQINVIAYVKQIGTISAHIPELSISELTEKIYRSPLFCPDENACALMQKLIEKTKEEGDSLGGVVEFVAIGLPTGLGNPIYEKLEAKLANAMMSLPATKGFEMGTGFHSTQMQGSVHNDAFMVNETSVQTITNHAGGILGGITTGMPIMGRVTFKPTSSVMKPQKTVTTTREAAIFQLPEGSRHDPCVTIRAVPVVEAMMALVLVDALLLNRCARL